MAAIDFYISERHEFGGTDPGYPAPGIMQVFYEDGEPVMVDFICPCGCGQKCPTHLATKTNPKKPNDRRWEFSQGPDGPTLYPSIRWTGGCKGHFNITDGKTIMHEDSGK